MSLDGFLRLLKRHALLFVLLPAITASTAWYATRHEKKVYRSESTLYTGLSSGYNLLTDRQSAFMDKSAAAFDNLMTTLMSKETLLQIGVNMLADHLALQESDSLVLGWNGYQWLETELPRPMRTELGLVGNDIPTLRRTLDSLTKAPTPNPIKTMLLASDAPYSVESLTAKLKGSARKNNNDVLLMEYEANDPAVAKHTLDYAIEVLNDRNTKYKTNETSSVVDYYQGKLAGAKAKLDQAEARMKAFSANNQVLDYDEEARNVATAREALADQYNQELMRRDAAKASLEQINKRLGQQGSISTANADLTEKRRKLAAAESQLANAQAYGQPKAQITRLQAAVSQASDELKASAQRYDATTSSSDALPQATLAADKLNKQLEYDESVARLQVYERRMAEYQGKTNTYGPLGSQLRQLTLDRELAEQEYKSLLQQVNQSQTRKQDVEVGGKLQVLDPPYMPIEPQASKRKQMIIIGLGVGIFLALLLTALRLWLDKRIQSPDQAEQLVGKVVAASFPVVKNPLSGSKPARAARTMFEQLFNAINIEIAQVKDKPYPPVITLFSVLPEQGKTWIANGLLKLAGESDLRIAYLYPGKTGRERKETYPGVTYLPYAARPDFMNVTNVDYLIDPEHDFESANFDRIIIEMPPLLNHQMPVYLLKNTALSLLVVDANSAWGRAEKQLMALYERVTSQPILLILNKIGGDFIDQSSAVAAAEPEKPTKKVAWLNRD
jgi:uncharacterized protein involved in exopolysaccharide biosynthesis